MLGNIFKYLFALIFVIGVAGAFTWILAKWLIINETAPDGALKVLGILNAWL